MVNCETKFFNESACQTLKMFGIRINCITREGAVNRIVHEAESRKKGLVVTPNVDHVVMLSEDSAFRRAYEKATLILADGMPLVWASRIFFRRALPERVTGADLLPAVCEAAAKRGLRVLLMGGEFGVSEIASTNLCNEFPGLQIVGTYFPPYGFERDEDETDRMIAYCNTRKPDILVLGVGAPKQEKWAADHFDRLETAQILCVGAALGFAAGVMHRAPPRVQQLGLEWIWRLAAEPRRLWRRYLLRDMKFIWLIAREVTQARH